MTREIFKKYQGLRAQGLDQEAIAEILGLSRDEAHDYYMLSTLPAETRHLFFLGEIFLSTVERLYSKAQFDKWSPERQAEYRKAFPNSHI